MNKKVVTRFAPSPTGFMHVGGVRTALYAWLLARQNNGQFILRIEDTDKDREVAGSIEHIQESLKWLGLNWDQGPTMGGPHNPYIQSERLGLYKKYADLLISKGLAYADPYTEKEINVFREKSEKEKRPFLYREHRPENPPAWNGNQALRFKISESKQTNWQDITWGKLSAGPEALDDFILIKSDGYPTYNFAHIVDDIEMGVTHVVRGQEFISSTPKFLALYKALEMPPPFFVTTPPIMSAEGKKKLSKRDGAKDILEYRNEGYLPDAMLNYLAFLGFNPGGEKEIYSREELVQAFDLSKVQRSGAQWNDVKLNWINKEHIKKLPVNELKKNVFAYLPDNYHNPKIIPIIVERISKWNDIKEMLGAGELDFFFQAPEYNKSKLIYKNISSEQISLNIKSVITELKKITEKDFNTENIKNTLMSIANKQGSRGEVLHPVRYALSGLDKSPDPFVIAEILGKNETISRLQKAV
ncbi:glutamate--tRNA ligase [Candidatus Nomurabacteria bacterium CG10_big_fil_rev_8_21_14_0_10_35_16]|uniref:Glutamate--tRNA ligase n=1 Tax=Candidatus Nomurabacteria bacterium CG10_big_fil_rev_8_21_14_0_10_35_16 TaxID=1974731 RepID=A0A2H0TC85_9BACT|nr:MAG: glutamate--tRNA ligase [Candidatus Nomurabacteria bacterium CG10_big_fil_rev_8_21_14_0_10_35_16]